MIKQASVRIKKIFFLVIFYTNIPFALSEETDELLIIGSLSPIQEFHLGNATTVITREDIMRQQSRYVTDLLRAVPGFSISQSGSKGSQTQIRVRGAEGNHVLVVIDGIRANDPANGDEFRWELLSAFNLEKIEIVRGPQSALWGSDALAAVVYIKTA
ncbi:MAG: TonB-dependent receptor plug domain-containing protein, partial [Pseudomonadota bacterium]|nr:TonB-dependent receptor plug domain-containing protein [Pseudomonadota bacterium]